jgi:hypothetical protein
MAQLHFCYLTNTYVAKNALQSEIQTYFKLMDRNIVQDVVGFMNMVITDIDYFSKSSKRCQPIKVTFFKSKGIDYQVAFKDENNRDLSILSFTLLEVKQ